MAKKFDRIPASEWAGPRPLEDSNPVWNSARIKRLRQMLPSDLTLEPLASAFSTQEGQRFSAFSVRQAISRHLPGISNPYKRKNGLWNIERIQRLDDLIGLGMSQGQIAAELSVEFGISMTRGSVAGAVDRHGDKLKNRHLLGERRDRPDLRAAARKRTGERGSPLSPEAIAAIPPAKLKTDDPPKHKHPAHIRVAARRFLEWRAAQ